MGNVIIPLAIVIVVGVAYIIPRLAKKNEKIANTRIEDRFSNQIKVLDTLHEGKMSTCCSGMSTIGNARDVLHLKNAKCRIKKTGLAMKKNSDLRIEKTKDMRMLAKMKSMHAANMAKRVARLHVRQTILVCAVLLGFALLGAYIASVVAIYFVLPPFLFAACFAIYMSKVLAREVNENLTEKNKIDILQKKIVAKYKNNIFVSEKYSAEKMLMQANNIKDSEKDAQNINSNMRNENVDFDEQENDIETTCEINVNENKLKDAVSQNTSWKINSIPAPLYARISPDKKTVATHDDLVAKNEKSTIYRPKSVSLKSNAVSTEQLSQDVHFDLEEIIRQRMQEQ